PPSGGQVSSTVRATPILASSSCGSCRERSAPAASPCSASSPETKSGSKRASTRSSGGVVGPVRMPVSSASSSCGASSARAPSMSLTWPTSPRRTAASCGEKSASRWPLRRVQPSKSAVLLHRRPQAGGVELGHVRLHLLLRTRGDHRPALVVHVQHQLGGVLPGVPEDLLEDVRHVRHQVDRVVPHHGH